MNLVGKIFIVLVTIMSVVFMTMALTVYATHQNWRLAVERKPDEVKGANEQVGLRYQLDDAKKRHQALQDEYDKLKSQVAEEKLAQRQALSKLESQRDELLAKRDALQKERDELMAKDKDAVAALDTAQKNLEKLTTEVTGLRKEIRLVQDDRNKQFRQVVDLTDKIHLVENDNKRMDERNKQVAAQYARLRDLANKYNFDKTADQPPADVHGKVLAVNAENLVEVSIGQDDGLKVGNTLEVYRGSKYLGKIQVVKLNSDRAVAKILPDFKLAPILKGDDVASRLKLS